MRTINRTIILWLLLTISGMVMAQDFNITRVELAGNKLVLFYNLTDTVQNRSYTVYVYSSLDSYLNPLNKISGDAGLEVVPGENKKITWDIEEEMGADFEGKVGLEVRGRLYIPFVRFMGFEDYKVLKRGSPFAITWSGGTRQNVLNFDLYQSDVKIWTQPNVANTGNYEMTIPTYVKPGKGYKFKISDTKNKDEVVYTGNFEIRRKVALGVKAIPVLAGGLIIGYLLSRDTDPSNLPDAPCPEGDNSCNE